MRQNMSSGFANNNSAALASSLVSVIVAHFLVSMVVNLATCLISKVKLVFSLVGWFGHDLVGNPAKRFSCIEISRDI